MKILDINALTEDKVKEEMMMARNEKRDYFLFPHRMADNSIRDVEVYSGPIELEGRTLLYSIINDITRRKAAEDDLKKSRDEWLSTFDAIPDMIYIVDDNHTIIRINRAVSERFKIPPEHIIGRKCHEVMHCSDEMLVSCPHEAILQGQTQQETIFMEPRLNSYFDLSACEIKDSEGNRVSSILMARDVTDKKRAMEEQAALEQRLFQAQKLETIGQLAGGIAHDFNNKLMIILGNAELAEKSNDISQIVPCIKEITRAAEHSRDITMQLLSFSRKQLISPRVVNVNNLIRNTSKSLAHLIGDNITFKYELDADLWAIKIDPVQLDQIIVNLAVNARDAMPDGGELVISTCNAHVTSEQCLHIIESSPGEYARISCQDSGVGMDEVTLKRIFEPFFTTKELGKGTGLGLATIFGIVRQNNGFIDTRSTLGKGSRFDIYLPREEVATETLQQTSDEPYKSGKGKILLLEDDETLRNLTSRFLEQLGYSVFVAALPSEAIKLVEKHHHEIDLILTDIMMPEMNGVQLVKQLRTQLPETKVIYISGYPYEHFNQNMSENEVEFMQKPVSLLELSKKIFELIHESTEI